MVNVKHNKSTEMGFWSEYTNTCAMCQKEKPVNHFLVERMFKGIEYFRYQVNCYYCRIQLEKKAWENEKATRFSK